MRDTRKKGLLALPMLSGLTLTSGAGALKAQMITAFEIPTPAAAIAAGPDGNLWFTETTGRNIGRLTTSGVVTEFPISMAFATTSGIAAGPDGNVWFTEYKFVEEPAFVGYVSQTGRIARDGNITEFPISGLAEPSTIVTGPGDRLWIGSRGEGKIGRFSTAGDVEGVVDAPGVRRITNGPDGNLWFTGNTTITSHVGRVTRTGAVATFAIGGFPSAGVSGIASGPDGNLWFTEERKNRIGRITTSGEITEFAIPTHDSGPSSIVAGADGHLWFTESRGNKIGRITTAGVLSECALGHVGSDPGDIAAGADGNLWFTMASANRIGRITTTATCATDGSDGEDENALLLAGGRFRAEASYRSFYGSGKARAIARSDSSGYFTFENPDSVELVVKVLDACRFGGGVWVFAAGLTDQEVALIVTDTETGQVRRYSNPLGTTFVTVTDTSAFSTCP